jgi:hypothetical protein
MLNVHVNNFGGPHAEASAVPARLGLIAPASARLHAAPAFQNDWPSRGQHSRPSPGLARLGPWLFNAKYINLQVEQYTV